MLADLDLEAFEEPKAEAKDDDDLFDNAEPEGGMPGFYQEGESDDDKQMAGYASTDASESRCPSSDLDSEAEDEFKPKRATSGADSP